MNRTNLVSFLLCHTNGVHVHWVQDATTSTSALTFLFSLNLPDISRPLAFSGLQSFWFLSLQKVVAISIHLKRRVICWRVKLLMNTLTKVCWFCDAAAAAATNNLFWVCGAIFKNWIYFAKVEAFSALAFFSGLVYIWIGIEISPLS